MARVDTIARRRVDQRLRSDANRLPTRPFVRVLVVALLLAGFGVVVPAGSGGAQEDPLVAAEARLAEARATADAAADRYFDALSRSQELDQELGRLEEELAAAETEAAKLQEVAAERAVEAYITHGSGTEAVLGTDSVIESARRATLLDSAGAVSQEAFEANRAAAEELRARRAELDATRGELDETLGTLEEESARLDGLLADAESEYQTLEARRREEQARAAAEAQARAERASRAEAERAAAPSSPAPASEAAPPPSASPAPAPAPPPGNGGTHPQHDHPFLACTRARESGGNYSVVNPAGPFYGAYQFLQSTWNATANHAGRSGLVGVVPSSVSPYDQDDMAWTLYQWQGKGPWGGRC